MPYTDYHWIIDRLAVGSLVWEPDDEFPFNAVLSLETWAPPEVREIVESGKVDYRWHSIIDGYSWEGHDEIVRRFSDAAAQIDAWLTDGRTVLVHCTAGISRSVTAVVWYLVRYQGYTWDDAYELVREQRDIAFPNPRFELALRVEIGEAIDWSAFDERVALHCEGMEIFGISVTHEEIMADLERQGTMGHAVNRGL